MHQHKQKILIITKNFPPALGGMEHLAWNLYMQLSKHYSCDVIAPCGAEQHIISETSNILTSPISPLPRFLFSAYRNAVKLSKLNNYILCIGCSGLMAPILSALKRKTSIKTITLVHGLDIIARSYVYQKFFVPRICKSDLIIANSQNTARITQKSCPSSKISVINPGVDSVNKLAANDQSFRSEFSLGSRPILLSIGRIIPRKGIAEFIEYCLPSITEQFPEILYCIGGEAPRHALNKTDNALTAIHDSIKQAGMVEHVLFLGKLSAQQLHNAYCEADLFIFPVLESQQDIEGFGMVAIEAAARGLPTMAFASGGIPDAVSPISGKLLQTGDYKGLASAIMDYLNGNHGNISAETCKQHASQFSWEHYGEHIQTEIKALLRDRQSTPGS